MQTLHEKRLPGENDAYRNARDQLLEMELDLRKRIEDVAAARRNLPPGGKLKEDYILEEMVTDEPTGQETVKEVRFSELFEAGKNSLIVYSFMYAPGAEKPCPMCTSLLDGLDGNAPHAQDRVNLVVIAKAPIKEIRAWALERGWGNLRFLSSGKTSFNTDYFAENSDGGQMPAVTVFEKRADGIYHFYSSELINVPSPDGQDPRLVDLIWPLWNLFDLTPDGRGTGWYPKFSYGSVRH